MAEVMGKSSGGGLIGSGFFDHQQQRRTIRNQIRVSGCRMENRTPALKLKQSAMRSAAGSGSGFFGRRVDDAIFVRGRKRGSVVVSVVSAQMTSGIIGRSHKWWEKGLQPNMKEVTSAQDLVDSLAAAGNKLVVLEFFSPGCGGCKALHPKICQLAEQNPDVQFLQLNHEDHKSLAYSLGVHVLPFFRFYRGAEGRLCSFSCTNATIKKFKDALAKHSTDRCSLGPAKGLEEKELIALAANKELGFSYKPTSPPLEPEESPILASSNKLAETVPPSRPNGTQLPLPRPLPSVPLPSVSRKEESLVNADR